MSFVPFSICPICGHHRRHRDHTVKCAEINRAAHKDDPRPAPVPVPLLADKGKAYWKSLKRGYR